jgi:hypothetical membrane protein
MKYTYYFGVIALVVAWTTIISSILISPTWDIMTGNLSQLGKVEYQYSYVYNTGLTVAGILLAIYSALASGIFLIASVHLIGVAIFASEADVHTFASGEFFLLASLAIFFFGIALLSDGYRKHGALSIAYFVIGWGGSIFVDFPSNAFLEIYNLILMSIWVVTLTRYCIRKKL